MPSECLHSCYNKPCCYVDLTCFTFSYGVFYWALCIFYHPQYTRAQCGLPAMHKTNKISWYSHLASRFSLSPLLADFHSARYQTFTQPAIDIFSLSKQCPLWTTPPHPRPVQTLSVFHCFFHTRASLRKVFLFLADIFTYDIQQRVRSCLHRRSRQVEKTTVFGFSNGFYLRKWFILDVFKQSI